MDIWNEDEMSGWKASLLKGFLREFYVEPMGLKKAEALSKVFVERRKVERATGVVTPTEAELRQVAQCYLLSFGRFVSWSAISSHELVRLTFVSDSTLFDYINAQVAIVYHGFDSLENSMTLGMVNQLIMGRTFRNRYTLVLMKAKDAGIEVKQFTTNSSGSSPRKAGSNPNIL